jgi:bifunctional non-homologous end joining protein LigD
VAAVVSGPCWSVPHDANGHLMYCGHVGFGFSGQIKRQLLARFSEIACAASPFVDLSSADDVNWVEPMVVVNVDYREFAPHLRHPSLKGLAEAEPHSVLLPYAK